MNMTPEQIREIVKYTLDELTARKLIKDDYAIILNVVEKKLRAFFNDKGDCKGVSYALNQLSDDKYIDVIFLQYRDEATIEWIAEALDVEVRTIMRNKKRLVKRIYELLEV